MSGEPHQRGAVLWTQLGQGERAGRLVLEVAADEDFRRVVHRQRVRAVGERDGVVRKYLSSRRLRPGERYWYRFESRTTSSPAGRFTTARPPDSLEPVRIGFFSCQDWGSGYYTAHAGLAQEDCDLIVCLGDYTYEGNTDGNVPDRADHSSGGESGEAELLDEYRAKYRLHRTDPDLRAMHESAAFVTGWDDHEVENNYAGDAAGTVAQAARRIPFAERRSNAYTAFFEQMPLRPVATEPHRLYRSYVVGGMVELLMLDLRQYRSDQRCDDRPAAPCFESSAPPRTLLGAAQRAWLHERLPASGAAWKLLASGVEMMSWDWVPGVPLNQDGWDGYDYDRRELGEVALRNGVRDIAVLTGDVHHFAAGHVTTTGRIDGRRFATEFVGGSITSGFMEQEPAPTILEAARATNPHMVFTDFGRRGYGVLDARPGELRVRYRTPATIRERTSAVRTLVEFRVPRGETRVETVSSFA